MSKTKGCRVGKMDCIRQLGNSTFGSFYKVTSFLMHFTIPGFFMDFEHKILWLFNVYFLLAWFLIKIQRTKNVRGKVSWNWKKTMLWREEKISRFHNKIHRLFKNLSHCIRNGVSTKFKFTYAIFLCRWVSVWMCQK